MIVSEKRNDWRKVRVHAGFPAAEVREEIDVWTVR